MEVLALIVKLPQVVVVGSRGVMFNAAIFQLVVCMFVLIVFVDGRCNCGGSFNEACRPYNSETKKHTNLKDILSNLDPRFATTLECNTFPADGKIYSDATVTIPESIGSYTNLRSLYIYGDQIVGTVPNSISSLTQLTRLSIYGTQLTGTLPASLDKLTNLGRLILANNPSLTGALPGWTSLERMTMSGFSLPPPNVLQNMKSLTDLIYCPRDRQPVPAFEQLTMLRSLQLKCLGTNQEHQITGTIGTNIGLLSNLRELSLQMSSIIGTIPDEINDIPGLRTLNIIGRGVNLDNLNLRHESMTKLWLSDISSTNFPNIAGLTSLTRLDLRQADFTGKFPSYFDNLNVRHLEIHDLDYVDGGFDFLTSLKNIQIARFIGNENIDVPLPSNFGQLTKLTEFAYDSNIQTKGPIPDMRQCTNLRKVSLRDNSFVGTFPSLPNSLTALDFRNNFVSGTIPDTIGQLTKLTALHATFNSLTGTLPVTLSSLPTLRELYVKEGNDLCYYVPHFTLSPSPWFPVGSDVTSLEYLGDCPTESPTGVPTRNPTRSPFPVETPEPTGFPTSSPSRVTKTPSKSPSETPSTTPTAGPTQNPSQSPNPPVAPVPTVPTANPTVSPSSSKPTSNPSSAPALSKPATEPKPSSALLMVLGITGLLGGMGLMLFLGFMFKRHVRVQHRISWFDDNGIMKDSL